MQKVCWKFKNSSIEPGKISEFSKKHSVSSVMATVLLNRGIETEEQIKGYLKKSLEEIHNPNRLPDMEKASQRIVEAIKNKEKITIYGDYDADGVTSTALLYGFLKDNGADVDYYIPDRMKEGYGLNIMSVNKISKKGTKLLVTVDCGIASFGEVELANAQKMDVIITDHHTCREKLPNAYAVINPKRQDSQYRFDALAGVGVAFKLALAVTMELGKNTTECFMRYVELAAIGTVADVVSLTGENRVIVDRGIKSLPQSKNYGINSLLEIAGVDGKVVNSTTIAFALSPRINAAGRMGNANLAVDLLLSKSDEEAYPLAVKLDEINKNRQKTEIEIFNEALEMIRKIPDIEKRKIIVLGKEGWHHGVVGIVASRICEMFYKPCILIAAENGKGKGSGRSVEGINLFDALSSCEDILTQFGGHALAAGMSLDMNDFDSFCVRMNKYIEYNIKKEIVKTLDIDCSVPSEFVTLQSAKQLEYLEPYGTGNEKPIFAMHGVKVVESTTVGVDNKHLRLIIEAGGKRINAIGFSMGHYAEYLTDGKFVDVAFNLGINEFRGNESVQLHLKDIRSSKV